MPITNQEKFEKHFGLNVAQVLRELRISEAAYERILKISIKTTAVSLDELAAAIDKDDGALAKSISHELKGVFGNLRVPQLRDISADMSDRLGQGESATSLRPLKDSLYQEFQILKGMFQ